MKSLIKRLIAWSRDQQAAEAARIAKTVAFHRPPPPPPTPEPSCFVKGLIHSMKTEPENWQRKYMFNDYHWVCRDVILFEGDKEPYYCPSSPLSTHESALLVTSIQEYLVRPMHERVELEVRRREVEKRASFERLGCPGETP